MNLEEFRIENCDELIDIQLREDNEEEKNKKMPKSFIDGCICCCFSFPFENEIVDEEEEENEDDNSESHRVFKIINCKSIKELNVSNFWFPFFDHAELISK